MRPKPGCKNQVTGDKQLEAELRESPATLVRVGPSPGAGERPRLHIGVRPEGFMGEEGALQQEQQHHKRLPSTAS